MAEGSGFFESLKSQSQWMLLALILLPLILVAFIPKPGPRYILAPVAMQQTRIIGMMIFQYASQHEGHFPDGKSSTEIFQKLIDEKYTVNPDVFFAKMRGKVPATSNKLMPENVSFDVTTPFGSADSDALPVVFLTGYRMSYAPGGDAVPLGPRSGVGEEGIAIFYHGTNSAFRKNDAGPDGIVHGAIANDFQADGKTYQQLTPDGPLSP
jgi:hypothetical protein